MKKTNIKSSQKQLFKELRNLIEEKQWYPYNHPDHNITYINVEDILNWIEEREKINEKD